MAKIEVVMPQMGESITTGTITKWHKAPGDTIDIDEILLEISTDKVESEIPSPVEGRVEQILYPEGETIDVGKPIAIIEDDLSIPFEAGTSSAAPAEIRSEAAPSTTAPVATASEPVTESEGERRFYTPLVKAMADQAGIPLSELASISGSGAGGRVNKADLEEYIKNRSAGPSNAPSAASSNVAAAPSVQAMSFDHGSRVEVVPMDNMRKAIAKNMVYSKQVSPHVNSVDEVDMTHLVKFRESVKNDFHKQEGFKLTYTHFIMYAIVQALKDHPLVNSSVDGDNIIMKKDINLGCAVAVPGNGLVVPVVKGADNLNLLGLARTVNELAGKAREKKLTMDELSGGTFTFTNVGSFGTLFATPVILQPQSGIMAAGVIKKRPIVTADDAIAIRHMLYLTHTYDHRIIDGQLGGQFLASVKKHLEVMKPDTLF